MMVGGQRPLGLSGKRGRFMRRGRSVFVVRSDTGDMGRRDSMVSCGSERAYERIYGCGVSATGDREEGCAGGTGGGGLWRERVVDRWEWWGVQVALWVAKGASGAVEGELGSGLLRDLLWGISVGRGESLHGLRGWLVSEGVLAVGDSSVSPLRALGGEVRAEGVPVRLQDLRCWRCREIWGVTGARGGLGCGGYGFFLGSGVSIALHLLVMSGRVECRWGTRAKALDWRGVDGGSWVLDVSGGGFTSTAPCGCCRERVGLWEPDCDSVWFKAGVSVLGKNGVWWVGEVDVRERSVGSVDCGSDCGGLGLVTSVEGVESGWGEGLSLGRGSWAGARRGVWESCSHVEEGVACAAGAKGVGSVGCVGPGSAWDCVDAVWVRVARLGVGTAALGGYFSVLWKINRGIGPAAALRDCEAVSILASRYKCGGWLATGGDVYGVLVWGGCVGEGWVGSGRGRAGCGLGYEGEDFDPVGVVLCVVSEGAADRWSGGGRYLGWGRLLLKAGQQGWLLCCVEELIGDGKWGGSGTVVCQVARLSGCSPVTAGVLVPGCALPAGMLTLAVWPGYDVEVGLRSSWIFAGAGSVSRDRGSGLEAWDSLRLCRTAGLGGGVLGVLCGLGRGSGTRVWNFAGVDGYRTVLVIAVSVGLSTDGVVFM
ncbi:hypothetical protein Tco_0418276 [Tanacetum coccineum]